MKNNKILLIKKIVDRKALKIKESSTKCSGSPCTTSCLACAAM